MTSHPAALDSWLAESASLFAEALRAAGPEAEGWTWAWDRSAGFWARRMAHEVTVHRRRDARRRSSVRDRAGSRGPP